MCRRRLALSRLILIEESLSSAGEDVLGEFLLPVEADVTVGDKTIIWRELR